MFFKEFSAAINAYGDAFKIISKLSLWKYFFIPGIIGFFFGGAVIALAYFYAADLGHSLSDFWTWDLGKGFVQGLGIVLSWILFILGGMLLYKHIVMAFSAPFMTPMSEKVEAYLSKNELPKQGGVKFQITSLARAIRLNLRNLFLEILLTIPLLILGFIPVINLFCALTIMYIQSFYAGYGNMDYTLERHFNYSKTKDFVKKHKGIAVGNGLLFNLILFIPFIGITLALPLSTVASTITTLRAIEGKIN